MTNNELTYEIRGAIFDVYNELGPGARFIFYKKFVQNCQQFTTFVEDH